MCRFHQNCGLRPCPISVGDFLLIFRARESTKQCQTIYDVLHNRTEQGMLNATDTAVCNLSEFYWCVKLCLFSCCDVVFRHPT